MSKRETKLSGQEEPNEQGAPTESQPVDASVAEESAVGVDLAAPGTVDQAIEAVTLNGQVISQRATLRNPDRCIVVRTVSSAERAYCSVDRGSHVQEEFRVNGRVPDGAEDVLHAFATTIALHVAQEARQRDIEVVRVSNTDAGKLTAEALREAGFYVIEFGE